MADKNVLLVEEQALHEQEQGLIHMEAQLHTEEQGIAKMERAFFKKTKALVNHASYVKEQEASLLRRAEAMGARAHELAKELLDAAGGQFGALAPDLGKIAERQRLLQQRKELMSSRMALLEEREALYAQRAEALESAEAQVGEIEGKLATRESAVAEAARKVFSAASELLDDDDDDALYGAASDGPGPVRDRKPTPAMASATEVVVAGSNPGVTQPDRRPSKRVNVRSGISEGPPIAGQALRVASGSVEQVANDESLGGVSRAEDKATRKRAGARSRVRTNQFKITLEAHLDRGEPHHFFRYENDGPEDLPGLFIATPNLLKVGREVRIRISMGGKFLEATGIVAWRRQRGEVGGSPGMGIELLNLSEPEMSLVGEWMAEKAPVTI